MQPKPNETPARPAQQSSRIPPAVELNEMPGQVLGHGFPDWPDDLKTFEERKAYQRGVAHARAVDASADDRPCAAATPLADLYAEHTQTARRLGFANVSSALGGLARRLDLPMRARMLTSEEILATWNVGEPPAAWSNRVAAVIRKFCQVNGIQVSAPGEKALRRPSPQYAVGDEVTYTNQQGVQFAGKTVVEIDQTEFPDGEPHYFIQPTDTPWVSFRESELTPAESEVDRSRPRSIG